MQKQWVPQFPAGLLGDLLLFRGLEKAQYSLPLASHQSGLETWLVSSNASPALLCGKFSACWG